MDRFVIETKKKIIPTEPSLYGLFFEDINRSADGGLYPEMLRNRAFDDSIFPNDLIEREDDLENAQGWLFEYQRGEGAKRWKKRVEETEIPAWYAVNAQMRLDRVNTLNSKREAALQISFAPGGKISNVGYEGICVRKGETYRFMMFAKTAGRMEVSFSIEEEQNVLCSQKLIMAGTNYEKYELVFKPDHTTKKGRFCITVKDGGDMTLGFTSLMPTDTYHGHGLRKDLCEMLEELSPAFLRFPGGCIVEGFSKSTASRFKRMVGPVWERPGVLNLWGYRATEGLGYHEYLQLCEDLGVEALYVCNVGMTCQARKCILMDEQETQELLDDVLCALEYALGSKETKWGELRANMGHPQPFTLKYLEIGNENNGPEYEKRYEYFRSKIAEKYPELVIIANTHVEEAGLALDIADEHYYDKPEWFAQNAHLFDTYDRKGPGIFVGEFAAVAGNIRTLYSALGEAMFMIGMERNQDVVKLAAYAPLFENVHYAAWEPNLIAFDGLEHYGIPTYHVMKLFAKKKGQYVLQSEQSCDKVYAPYLKGAPCISGSAGIRYRNVKWKGMAQEVTRELFGTSKSCGDGTYITEIHTDDGAIEAARRYEMEDTVLLTIGGDVCSRAGRFEIEVLAQAGQKIGLGMFATPYGKARNSEDSPWNLFAVQPIRWMIENGKSHLYAGVGFRQYELTEAVELSLEENIYHKMEMDSDGKYLTCIADGETIMKVELPHYDEIETIALEDDKELILKVVNIADEEKTIEIELDREVESSYKRAVIAGKPEDMNSLANPNRIVEKWSTQEGAGKCFVYEAPASSVNVLCLTYSD